MEILLERIKDLCKSRSITVSKLEDILELPSNTIYQWKKRVPNTERLQLVADYFTVSIDYLLGRTDRKDPWPASTPEEDFGYVMEEKDLMDMVENAQTFDGHQLDQHDKDAIVAFLIGRMSGK